MVDQDLIKLKSLLDLIAQYPRIKAISVERSGGVLSFELYEEPRARPMSEMTSIPTHSEMPSDDVMLFASTPTFDELMEKPKE